MGRSVRKSEICDRMSIQRAFFVGLRFSGWSVNVAAVTVLSPAFGAPIYDMELLLNQRHPFGYQNVPQAGDESVVKPIVDTPAPNSPLGATSEKNMKASSDWSGVFRFELLNEDVGLLGDIVDPILDPLGGDRGKGQLTWGWRFSYTPDEKNPEWFQAVRGYLPWLDDRAKAQLEYAFEQYAFVPNKFSSFFGWTDRPYVGLLGLHAKAGLKGPLKGRMQRIDELGLRVGVAGPGSGAEQTHQLFHDALGINSRNWSDEINTEPFVNANYEYAYRFFAFKPGSNWNMEAMPHAGVTLGNALTYANVGFTARIGGNLEKDSGPPRMRYLASGTNFPEPGDYWVWNFFTGLEARVFAHNITLDGNTFQDSSSVDKEIVTYEGHLGFEFGYGGYRLSATNVVRSKEFEGDQQTDIFLRAGLSAAF